MTSYVFGKTVALPFDSAVQRITEELAQVGFGVLTEIDVQATMKKKLDQDMPPYRILGACNPQFASRAIAAEPSIGALLPCKPGPKSFGRKQTMAFDDCNVGSVTTTSVG